MITVYVSHLMVSGQVTDTLWYSLTPRTHFLHLQHVCLFFWRPLKQIGAATQHAGDARHTYIRQQRTTSAQEASRFSDCFQSCWHHTSNIHCWFNISCVSFKINPLTNIYVQRTLHFKIWLWGSWRPYFSSGFYFRIEGKPQTQCT